MAAKVEYSADLLTAGQNFPSHRVLFFGESSLTDSITKKVQAGYMHVQVDYPQSYQPIILSRERISYGSMLLCGQFNVASIRADFKARANIKGSFLSRKPVKNLLESIALENLVEGEVRVHPEYTVWHVKGDDIFHAVTADQGITYHGHFTPFLFEVFEMHSQLLRMSFSERGRKKLYRLRNQLSKLHPTNNAQDLIYAERKNSITRKLLAGILSS
ncbi:hypothetical protein KW805_00695 [Candidatus Pacearchaeota archaeon]|nr:hypothetical protein [Candidatus Pacearchaeota archaeon]